jgi:hypothetical protein
MLIKMLINRVPKWLVNRGSLRPDMGQVRVGRESV